MLNTNHSVWNFLDSQKWTTVVTYHMTSTQPAAAPEFCFFWGGGWGWGASRGKNAFWGGGARSENLPKLSDFCQFFPSDGEGGEEPPTGGKMPPLVPQLYATQV